MKSFTLEDLRDVDLYLATPYSKYPGGLEEAFVAACKLAGELLKRGLTVFSPITHTHPIAMHAGIDPLDYKIWLPCDRMRMDTSDALLVAMMRGWEASVGIQHEIDYFMETNKPVHFLDVRTIELKPVRIREKI